MAERLLNRLSVWEAKRVSKKVVELGGRTCLIGNGDDFLNLDQVLSGSLLGKRIPGCQVDLGVLSPYELSLQDKKHKILVVVDLDGVVVSPFHIAREILTSPESWLGGLEELKRRGRIKLENLRWLSKVVKAADMTVLWTSRLSLEENSPFSRWITHLAEDTIDYFPFFSPDTVRRVKQWGGGKLRAEPKKPLGRRSQTLEKIVENTGSLNRWDMVYYVGSSHFDRKAVLELLQRRSDLVQRIVFFDTCHLVL